MLALLTACVLVSEPPPPRVDGLFGEWTNVPVAATDPLGDASGAFDITEVSVLSRGSRLHLRFDTNASLNLQAGNGSDGTVRIEVGMPGSQHLTIDTRARVVYRNLNPNDQINWSDIDYRQANTYAAPEAELRMDLSLFGVGVGSQITLQFGGSDSLAAPITFTMLDPAEPARRRPAMRAPGSELRVMSLNTLQTGLFNSSRGDDLGRIINAIRADVYCFQEEYGSTSGAIASLLAGLDPHGDGAAWNVHKNNDNVIASRATVIGLPQYNTRYAAAVTDFGAGRHAVVFSIHPSCCGYTGNSSDQNRISQTMDMVRTMDDLTSGALGPAFEAYEDAPVIVIGDWNLVGSRTPLDLLTDPAGPALTHRLLPHLIGEDIVTWRNDTSSFSPGLLDLLVFDAHDLHMRRGYILDSQQLNGSELQTLGLLSSDSLASDHLTLVADFTWRHLHTLDSR